MKSSEEFIVEVKTKYGEQRTRDGQLIRDMDDRELMKKMLERYPSERENIVDIEEYLGEDALGQAPEKSEMEKKLDNVKKSPGFLERVKNAYAEREQNVKDIKASEDNPLSKGLQAFAQGTGLLADTALEGIKTATPDFIEKGVEFVGEKIGEGVQKGVIDPLSETELIKGAAEGYNAAERGEVELPPLAKAGPEILRNLQAGGEIAATVAGIKPTVKGVGMATDVAKKIPGKVDEIMEPRRQARIEKNKQTIEDTVKRITQAVDDKDVEAAKRTLSRIDVNDVKDYKGFKEAIDDDITALSRSVDAELDKYPTKYKPAQLGVYERVGNETVTTTPVQNALDGLESAYKQSGEAVAEAKIRQLKTKLETEGLTVKEINNLAREYGIEYKDRAFSKLGDPKPGYNAESFENTRKGLKQVARDRMPDDTTKELDQQISDSYTTRDMVSKLDQEVAKAQNKIREYSLTQKLGRAVYTLADLATIGTLTGFVSRLNLKAGKLYVNRLELNDELAKSLKKLQKLNETKDPKKFSEELERYIEEDLSPGLGIKNTVTPAKVANSLTRGEYRTIINNIDDIETAKLNPDFNELIEKVGLARADDITLERFLKDTIDEYEGEADRPIQTTQP